LPMGASPSTKQSKLFSSGVIVLSNLNQFFTKYENT